MFALVGFIIVIFVWMYAISGEITVRSKDKKHFDRLNYCRDKIVAPKSVLNEIHDEYIYAKSQEDILSQVNDEMMELYGENYRDFIKPFSNLFTNNLYSHIALQLSDFWSQVYLILLAKRGYVFDFDGWMHRPFETSYGCVNKYGSDCKTRDEINEEWRVSTLNAIRAAQIINKLINEKHPEMHVELLFCPWLNPVNNGRVAYMEEDPDIKHGNLEWNFKLTDGTPESTTAIRLDRLKDKYNLGQSFLIKPWYEGRV